MVRDTARVAIPPGAVYDSADYLLHQPGVAQKRGGTAYAGPALTGSTSATTTLHVPFTAGAQLLAIGSNQHLYKVTAGTTTDIGGTNNFGFGRMCVSPGGIYAILPFEAAVAQKYDGTTISTLAGGMGLNQAVSYKSRLVASSTATPNRLLFSGTPDVNVTWDTTNSYIDCDNQVSGLAALNTALLIFSTDHMERIIGATPPPNSDMDRAPVAPVGCTDCRSIVQVGQNVYFANPEGVYLTNGSTPVSLTEQGGIASYWRSLFSGYISAAPVPLHTGANWTISAGFWRGFLFVTILNDSRVIQANLMCNVARRSWWRLTNMNAMGYTIALDGNECYYADGSTNRVVALSGIFSPAAGNKNDANGTAVTPTIEFAPVGGGSGVKSYGFGRLDFDMRDSATDNPTMAVTVKSGIEADTSTTPAESPLVETTTLARPRFSVCREAQAVTIALAQTNASSKTEIYAVEVEQRPQSLVGDGVS